jgi:hypothetical protein
MATNFFFNNFSSSQEQQLIDNLVVESIKMHGLDVYYLPRSIENKDEIYGEDPVSRYESSYLIEMYIKDILGFEGEGDFLSRFNLQIRDQITFTVANRPFDAEVGAAAGITRPREGDLIYFPLNEKVFQIKFVEHEAVFYQLGSLQMYDLVCDLFEYSNEVFNTGIPQIDDLEATYSFATSNYDILTEDNYTLLDEDGYPLILEEYNWQDQVGDSLEDNTEIQYEADQVLDFSESDPFSEGAY